MDRDAVAYVTPPDAPPIRAGLNVVHTVEDPDPHRAGLAEALRLIESGRAQVLLTGRLASVASSLRDLVHLIDWLGSHGATLIAADLGLDTARPAGQLALDVLREVDRWAREPELPRRPPGRPGLQSISPELAQRIGRMREQGLSLHAIAHALNAEGVPTPRGGAQWRASSVQTALGYRRPRPGPGGPPRPPAGRPEGPRHRRPCPGPGGRR